MSDSIKPRPIEWTAAKVERFWEWWASSGPRNVQYFSETAARDVIELAAAHGALRGRILDFGCGKGHLLEALLRRGIACEGLDLSAESVAATKARCASHPRFGGVIHAPSIPVPLPDESFDTVFLVEAIEHLLPDQLASTLGDIHRLLRRGGKLVITTPNEEDLLANSIMCPDCGAVFHRMQHVSSFSRDSMAALLRKHGFDAATETRNIRSRSPLNAVRDAVRRLRNKKDRNLFAVGTKR